jgi:hypothetical protein
MHIMQNNLYRLKNLQQERTIKMKSFKNVTVSDFPGVDTKKFDEWKQAVIRTRGVIYIVLIIYLVLNIKSYGQTGYIIYDTPLVILTLIMLIAEHSRYAQNKQTTYAIASLAFLIVFNIILFLITGRYIGESLIVIVVLTWLINRYQKNNRSAVEMGINTTALKRTLSK